MEIFNALDLKKGAKSEHNKTGGIYQPLQFLPREEKDMNWSADTINFWEWEGLKQVRRNARRLLKNYKLAKGIIDKRDYIVEDDTEYSDLIEVLTKEDSSALELKFYPIIPNAINTLVSEFAKRNTSVSFKASDDRLINEMMEAKREQLEKSLIFDAQMKMTVKLLQAGM